MKRRYEEIARSEFDQLAKLMFADSSLTWEDVPQELEPPDWFLSIKGTRYAVEATTIVDQVTVTPTTKMAAPRVLASIHDFVKEVERAAQAEGILSGAYVIGLSPIPNLSEHRDELKDRFLNYIRRTQRDSSAPEELLGYIREHRTTITKVHDQRDYVTVGVSLGVKWDEQAQDELRELLSAALADKAHKVRTISEPVILLILDDYVYSDSADWALAISECADKERFFCICRIRPPDGTSILWASSSDWRPNTSA